MTSVLLPADVSWCQPGGICDTNPELYCTFFGAIGPNKMHLNCATCKQIPDECWQKIGNNTTNLTHCIQTCPGLCTYEGKYKVSDKPVKFRTLLFMANAASGSLRVNLLGWGSSTDGHVHQEIVLMVFVKRSRSPLARMASLKRAIRMADKTAVIMAVGKMAVDKTARRAQSDAGFFQKGGQFSPASRRPTRR